jgi:uncharacterized protein (TIRG00374 family)
MEQSMADKFKTRRWKLALTILTFLALAGLIYALRHEVLDTLGNLKTANPLPILLIIPLAALNHYCQGKMFQGIFRILGHRFRAKSMMRLSLELNFVSQVFPSAGLSALSYLSLKMRGEGVAVSQAALVQMIRLGLWAVSFQLLLGLGLLLLALVGDVSNFVMLVAGSLATLLSVITILLIYVLGSRARLNMFFVTLTRVVNYLIHVFRPKNPETINLARVEAAFTELHKNYRLLRKNWTALRRPLFFTTLASATDMLAIWSVFWAFSQLINPGAVIVAVSVATFAGMLSILPAGIGVYETLMTGTFAAVGVSVGLALPVILAFRIVSMAVHLTPGYFFYQRTINYQPAGSRRG